MAVPEEVVRNAARLNEIMAGGGRQEIKGKIKGENYFYAIKLKERPPRESPHRVA